MKQQNERRKNQEPSQSRTLEDATGALVFRADGRLMILPSNDVRVNLYLLATQKLLAENKPVQQMVANEITKMMEADDGDGRSGAENSGDKQNNETAESDS